MLSGEVGRQAEEQAKNVLAQGPAGNFLSELRLRLSERKAMLASAFPSVSRLDTKCQLAIAQTFFHLFFQEAACL